MTYAMPATVDSRQCGQVAYGLEFFYRNGGPTALVIGQ